MLIAIPSCGRAAAERQVTLRSFAKTSAKPVLCVPEAEVKRYALNNPKFEIVPVPGSIKGISDTREWIMGPLAEKRGERYVLMLDDDMDFCYRKNGMLDAALDTIKSPEPIDRMVSKLHNWLVDGFVHVGVSARQGNNHFPVSTDYEADGTAREYRDATRMMNAYAYDTHMLRKLGVSVGRNKVMHDFDLTLQLLRLGYPNRVSFYYCWNQRGSGASGGCSTYRDAAMQAASAHQLKTDHPDFVKVVMKKSKGNWHGLQERADVIVQWQKAYASAKVPA